jgi:glycosyltransferase A (GT-A) superfamily protein (DUF2064 family)
VLRTAAAALTEADLVICPDPDGGYSLVGLGRRALEHGPSGNLFSHAMSTPTVLRDTLARAERLQLRVQQLSPGFDIDCYDDLRRLAGARLNNVAIPCERTLAFLDAGRFWPAGKPSRSALPSSP